MGLANRSRSRAASAYTASPSRDPRRSTLEDSRGSCIGIGPCSLNPRGLAAYKIEQTRRLHDYQGKLERRGVITAYPYASIFVLIPPELR
ncbi:hypothetical protein V2G26_001265 [Clonostachys chloroleuca]